ncbi:MAG: HEPN domain-containing protein [Clostridiales bacterium]|nr:HEPN domain-containing protein [Clostridiales bacterium]
MMPETKEWHDMAVTDLGVAKHLKDKVDIENKFYDYADTLTPYGVSVRYPNELFLEDRHADEAIQYASEILQWATEILATYGEN